MFGVEESLAKICATASRFGKVKATSGVGATSGLGVYLLHHQNLQESNLEKAHNDVHYQ